jgi:fatty-acyl-CoA synthase
MKVPLTPIRFLRYAREQYPRQTAIVCGDQRFTYAQFAERAGRLAGALRAAGMKPGDRVAFLSANCHRLLEAYYGVVEAGGVLLPLNIRLAPQELAYILTDAGARFLFLQDQFLSTVDSFRQAAPSVESFILLDGQPQASWLAPRNYEDLLDAATVCCRDVMEFDEDSLAELFYTSGTSADPKGVMLTHRNIYLHALSAAISLGAASETILHTIPLFHANGWGVAHSVTFLGGTHVMIRHFDPVEVFRMVERERVNGCALVPTMAIALVNCPQRHKYDLSSLKRITLGGAASSPTLVREVEEKLGCTCISGYGLTETAPVLTNSTMKPGIQWQGEERYEFQARTGHAIPGVEIRVVDEDGNDVPGDGKTMGEIVARGDGVMEGYWRQPEATAKAFQGGWFHTGDMATIDENGYLLIVDRKKDIIVSGGENISSLEVEKALAAHPSVYEAAVIPVPDEKWGEAPMALVVLKPGSTATEKELIEFCRAQLAHYKAPKSVEFLDSLPKTGTGKIWKRELRKKYWGGRATIRPEYSTRK